MNRNEYLVSLPNHYKLLITVFLLVLTFGYFSSLLLIQSTTNVTPKGIVENYNGNEYDEKAKVMKFKKSKHEILSIVHTHILSLSIIFFIQGLLTGGAKCSTLIKKVLMIEPLISVFVTFGGIYLIWSGMEWLSYIVMLSGALMTISFVTSSIIILYSISDFK